MADFTHGRLVFVLFRDIDDALRPWEVHTLDSKGMCVQWDADYCRSEDEVLLDAATGKWRMSGSIRPDFTPGELAEYWSSCDVTVKIPEDVESRRLPSLPDSYLWMHECNWEETRSVCCEFCDDHLPDRDFAMQPPCQHLWWDESIGEWSLKKELSACGD